MRLALRSITKRPGRAVMTVVGVGLAIALAVTMFSLSEGVRASTRDLVSASGVDIFLYAQGTNPLLAGNPNAPAGEVAGGHAVAAAIAAEPGVRAAAPMLHEPVFVIAEGGVSDANTLGYDPSTTTEFVRPTFTRGGPMLIRHDPVRESGYDASKATGEAVVNENLARALGLEPGDTFRLSLSPTEPTNDLVFRLNGVSAPDFESPRERTVYLHLGELQIVAEKAERDVVDFIGVKVEDPREADAIARRLEQKHPVAAFTNDDLVGEVGKLSATFEGFAQMIGIVTLAVALLFVTTVMMVVVNERTAELGALRAIGMPRARVFQLVLTEAAILVALATLIGFAVGYVGAIGFDDFLRSTNAERTPSGFRYTKVSLPLLAQVSGLVALMGLVAGLVPAWRATRVNLLSALRSV